MVLGSRTPLLLVIWFRNSIQKSSFSYTFTFPLYSNPKALPGSELFAASLETAKRIAAVQGTPIFLRNFDLVTTNMDPKDLDDVVEAIFNMTAQVVAADPQGVFVVENLKLVFDDLALAVVKANARVIAAFGKNRLLFCYDPANFFIFTNEGSRLSSVTSSLQTMGFPPLGLLHLKQSRGPGDVLTMFTVRNGLVDWPLLTSLILDKKTLNYQGPVLFEITPSMQILDFIAEGRQLLNDLGYNVGV